MPTKLKASLGINATGTPSSTTFLRGDNSWGAAGATAGTIIQVVTATDYSERSTSSTSYVTVGTLSVNITPSSSSSRFLLSVTSGEMFGDGPAPSYTFYRDSTNLGDATNGMQDCNDSQRWNIYLSYIDSPATTSTINYTVRFRTQGSSYPAYFNFGTTTTGRGSPRVAAPTRGSFIVMEIKG